MNESKYPKSGQPVIKDKDDRYSPQWHGPNFFIYGFKIRQAAHKNIKEGNLLRKTLNVIEKERRNSRNILDREKQNIVKCGNHILKSSGRYGLEPNLSSVPDVILSSPRIKRAKLSLKNKNHQTFNDESLCSISNLTPSCPSRDIVSFSAKSCQSQQASTQHLAGGRKPIAEEPQIRRVSYSTLAANRAHLKFTKLKQYCCFPVLNSQTRLEVANDPGIFNDGLPTDHLEASLTIHSDEPDGVDSRVAHRCHLRPSTSYGYSCNTEQGNQASSKRRNHLNTDTSRFPDLRPRSVTIP